MRRQPKINPECRFLACSGVHFTSCCDQLERKLEPPLGTREISKIPTGQPENGVISSKFWCHASLRAMRPRVSAVKYCRFTQPSPSASPRGNEGEGRSAEYGSQSDGQDPKLRDQHADRSLPCDKTRRMPVPYSSATKLANLVGKTDLKEEGSGRKLVFNQRKSRSSRQ